jgi:CheY-like chemotaxis protein
MLYLIPDQNPPPAIPFPQADEPASLETRQSSYILVIEDNPADVSLIKRSLCEHDVDLEVVVLRDGELAVRLLPDLERGVQRLPALILLDLNLPKVSGLEVLSRVRSTPALASVPVAIFSSSEAPKDRQAAAALGADRYIHKPADLDGFLQIGGILSDMLSER